MEMSLDMPPNNPFYIHICPLSQPLLNQREEDVDVRRSGDLATADPFGLSVQSAEEPINVRGLYQRLHVLRIRIHEVASLLVCLSFSLSFE